MEQQEKLSQFRRFIDRFYKNIDTKNYNQIKALVASIESFEEIFLSNYQRRKKEGVYYTVESISKFIFKEALILFFKTILNNGSPNATNIQSIDQISKLDPIIQQKIVKTLDNSMKFGSEVTKYLIKKNVIAKKSGIYKPTELYPFLLKFIRKFKY